VAGLPGDIEHHRQATGEQRDGIQHLDTQHVEHPGQRDKQQEQPAQYVGRDH
jgi:hypothetical protein